MIYDSKYFFPTTNQILDYMYTVGVILILEFFLISIILTSQRILS